MTAGRAPGRSQADPRPPGGPVAVPGDRGVSFLLPGNLEIRTGGYRYDRRIVLGLRERGWQVELLSLDRSFPMPSPKALRQAGQAVAALPDGALVVADALAYGAMPEIAARHAQRLRWVALVHHPLYLETGLDAAAQARLKASETAALAVARHVIVTSPGTARDLAALAVPADRITVVEPGTDPAPLSPGSPAGADLNLLCVATLTPRKGHRVLLEALAGLTDQRWQLHCLGSLTMDPPTAEAVRRAIAEHGLQGRVHLHGEADDNTLAAAYARADLFVLPSFHEGYGMVLTEALARGLTIVSTTGGAIPQTVPADAGELVPPHDAQALRAALARMLGDAGWRASRAAGARAARARLADWQAACASFAAALDRAA